MTEIIHLCSDTEAVFQYQLNGRTYTCEMTKHGPLWTDPGGIPWKVQPMPGGKHWAKFEEWRAA